MTFYERLKLLMKETGITQKELTQNLGINKNSFSYWKLKGNTPNGEIILKLAKYFDVSVPYLLGETEIKKRAVPSEQPLTPMQEKALDMIMSLPDSALEDLMHFLDALQDKQ